MVEWYKDLRQIPKGKHFDKRLTGKAFITSKGILRIKKLSSADAGEYTCTGIKFIANQPFIE